MAVAFIEGVIDDLEFTVGSKAVTFGATPSNDELIILFYWQNAASPATRTWPTGFTEFWSSAVGGSNEPSLHAAWKIAASEGSATYTLSLGDSNDNNQLMTGYRFSGAHTTTPIDVQSAAVLQDDFFYNETRNIATITTTVDGAMVVWLLGSADDLSTGTTSSGYTVPASLSAYGRDKMGYAIKATAGATGNIPVTQSTAGFAPVSMFAFAIKPAGGGGTEYTQDISGVIAQSGTLIRSARKSLSGAPASNTGTVSKRVNKPLAGIAGALTGAITKRANKVLTGISGAYSGAVTSLKTSLVSLSGTMGNLTGTLSSLRTSFLSLAGTAGAFTGTLFRITAKPLTGTAGAIAGGLVALYLTLYNTIEKSLRASSMNVTMPWRFTLPAPDGDISSLDRIMVAFMYRKASLNVIFQSISGTAGAVSGTLFRSTAKPLAGATGTVSGTLFRLTSKILDGTMGALTGVLSTLKLSLVVLDGVVGDLTGTLSRMTLKPLAGAISTVSGTLFRLTFKPLSGAAGALTGTVDSIRTFLRVIEGSVGAMTGSLSRLTGLNPAGTIDATGDIIKLIFKPLTGAISSLTGSLVAQATITYLVDLAGDLASLFGAVTYASVIKRAKMKAGYITRNVMIRAGFRRR